MKPSSDINTCQRRCPELYILAAAEICEQAKQITPSWYQNHPWPLHLSQQNVKKLQVATGLGRYEILTLSYCVNILQFGVTSVSAYKSGTEMSNAGLEIHSRIAGVVHYIDSCKSSFYNAGNFQTQLQWCATAWTFASQPWTKAKSSLLISVKFKIPLLCLYVLC